MRNGKFTLLVALAPSDGELTIATTTIRRFPLGK